MAKNPLEPEVEEILSSDKIGNYLSLGFGLGNVPDNPSWIWEQLRFNPWMAMFVYEDMEEKDAKVGSDLESRKEAVLALERHVLPASDKRQDQKLATFVEETLEGYFDSSNGVRFGFDNVLWEALDAVSKGVSIGEVIFGNGRDRVFISDVRFKPQSLFSFGEGPLGAYASTTSPLLQTGPLRIRPGMFIDGVSSDVPLPPRKFFVNTFRPRHGNRWGMPIDRKVFWASWFKRASVTQWLRFLEKGPGSIVTRYNDGAGEDERNKALEAAQAINEESAVALPKKFISEVLQHVRQSMGSAYREMVDDFCNNEIARVILGQTLTSRGSEGGGSRALGEVHERVAGRKAEVDAKGLMWAVNTQLVWPIVLFNQGPVEQPPIWTINYEPGADLDGMSTWLQRLWEMNLPIGKKWVYNEFQIAEPGPEDELLEQQEKDPAIQQPPAAKDIVDSFAEGDDPPATDPVQKKKLVPRRKVSPPLSSKKGRFGRLRPSEIEFSED